MRIRPESALLLHSAKQQNVQQRHGIHKSRCFALSLWLEQRPLVELSMYTTAGRHVQCHNSISIGAIVEFVHTCLDRH
jgi:hypothetical protein